MSDNDEEDDNIMGKINKDLKALVPSMSIPEIRVLVDTYYQAQKKRIVAQGQCRALDQGADSGPADHEVLTWLMGNTAFLENQVKYALDLWGRKNARATWARTICGIGPIMGAALTAYINPVVPTAGAIWRHFGMDPTSKWIGRGGAGTLMAKYCEAGVRKLDAELIAKLAMLVNLKPDTLLKHAKGKTDKTSVESALARCPWNAKAKVLAFKLGESFVKVQNSEKDYYGHLIAARKVLEWQNNIKGVFAQQAAEKMANNNIMDAYSRCFLLGKIPPAVIQGLRDSAVPTLEWMEELLPYQKSDPNPAWAMLTPGHIDMRARRPAIKLFLSHFHLIGYFLETGALPPVPFPMAQGDHAHEHLPPNLTTIPGLENALDKAGRLVH